MDIDRVNQAVKTDHRDDGEISRTFKLNLLKD